MYIAIFYNHFGAIKFSKILEDQGVRLKLIPAPRQLSSNCNIACEFIYNEDINNVIIDDIEKIYIKKDEYLLVYEDNL